jgi:hypothetical protein
MQFKMWPLAAMHDIMVRNFAESLSAKDAVIGSMAVLGLGTLSGYLRMTAKDVIVDGEQPQIPTTVGGAFRLAGAALAQSGGLGIFGDMLFGEINRFGAAGASAIGGPVATDIGRLGEVFHKFTNDPSSDWEADLIKAGIQHVPFANLFYLKQGLDYLPWYHVFDAIKPGCYQRSNDYLHRSSVAVGQAPRVMYGYHGQSAPPYWPPMLGGQ